MTSNYDPEFVKKLSPNDVGATRSHQAGFLIPIRIANTNYFPKLDTNILNPRESLTFHHLGPNEILRLNYIYYNSRYHGSGTRLEYRLTGLTSFIRKYKLTAGDEIEFFRRGETERIIKIVRRDEVVDDTKRNLAYISRNGWKIKERPLNES
jgi:hypothetical protein